MIDLQVYANISHIPLHFVYLQVNIYLISQLEVTGLFAIFGYVGIALLAYYYNLHQRGQSFQIIPPERMLSLKKTQR